MAFAIYVGFSGPAWGAPQGCSTIFSRFSRPLRSTLNPQTSQLIAEYLAGTLNSLEQMRGENGLVSDTIFIQTARAGTETVQTLNPNTSPTNIAVDLLIQNELTSQPKYSTRARERIGKVLATLEQLSYHQETGLIFSRYSTDATSKVTDHSVSSIDNLHLAIALWTLQHDFSGTLVGHQARRLLERMNFSVFYDEKTGMLGGNLSYHSGAWAREAYLLANLGSEARLLYSAGWALGLFKDIQHRRDFLSRAFAALEIEVLHTDEGDILKLWDGSAFQMYFPKMFINEELYSEKLKKMFLSYADYMVSEGRRRQLPAPAAHSAGMVAFALPNGSTPRISYKAKSGDPALVSSKNADINDPETRQHWDTTFAPNALFMAATADPEKFVPLFEDLSHLKSGNDSLYSQRLGWMDGYQVDGAHKGQVIPIQLSLNQGMIALSLLQMQSPDGLSASSRALFNSPAIKSRLLIFYEMFEKNLHELNH